MSKDWLSSEHLVSACFTFICRDNHWHGVQVTLILVTPSQAVTESELHSSKPSPGTVLKAALRCNFFFSCNRSHQPLLQLLSSMCFVLWATNNQGVILPQLNNHLWRVQEPMASVNSSLVSVSHPSAAPDLPGGLVCYCNGTAHKGQRRQCCPPASDSQDICRKLETLFWENSLAWIICFPIQSILLSIACGILETSRVVLKTRATTCS